MAKICPTCGDPVASHPYIGGRPTARNRFCDLVPVIDRPRNDGSGRVVTVGADPGTPRTRENNFRWVRASSLDASAADVR